MSNGTTPRPWWTRSTTVLGTVITGATIVLLNTEWEPLVALRSKLSPEFLRWILAGGAMTTLFGLRRSQERGATTQRYQNRALVALARKIDESVAGK